MPLEESNNATEAGKDGIENSRPGPFNDIEEIENPQTGHRQEKHHQRTYQDQALFPLREDAHLLFSLYGPLEPFLLFRLFLRPLVAECIQCFYNKG